MQQRGTGNKAGITAVETQFYKHQLEDKDLRYKELQKQQMDDQDRFQAEKNELIEKIGRVERDKVAVESDLRHALALGDETEHANLRRQMEETDAMNKKLMVGKLLSLQYSSV